MPVEESWQPVAPLGVRAGDVTVADAAGQPDMTMARNVPTNRVAGSPATALAQLDRLLATTGADELMVTTVAYGLDVRVRSLELLAAGWPAVRTASAPS